MRRPLFTWTEGVNPRLVPVQQAPLVQIVRTPKPTVVGLDLSLNAAAACSLPIKGWKQSPASACVFQVGRKLQRGSSQKEQLDRIEFITQNLVDFCKRVHARRIYIEDYAFSQGQSMARAIGELGGVVKHEIRKQLHIVVSPVVASHARKIMLQWLPKKDVKPYVVWNVKRLGGSATGWTDDQIDAFVVANYGIMRSGGQAITFEGEEL